ncbi:hypothetical protein [Desulfotalea psychrophila]|uniref:hypothetical protein n=1 Tax=Desulfotalea psychrophila TaxID=84980 RepID=UPI00030C9461|nr:hypothetical protein [Desulfotalea psychrophila]
MLIVEPHGDIAAIATGTAVAAITLMNPAAMVVALAAFAAVTTPAEHDNTWAVLRGDWERGHPAVVSIGCDRHDAAITTGAADPAIGGGGVFLVLIGVATDAAVAFDRDPARGAVDAKALVEMHHQGHIVRTVALPPRLTIHMLSVGRVGPRARLVRKLERIVAVT